MQKEIRDWYTSWFNTPYYHLLYKDRGTNEAVQFMDNLMSFLKLKKGSSVLDLACGKGRHAKHLHSLGYDVTGVDLSPKSIEAAKEYEQPGLQFDVHDMCLPYPKKFDAVVNLFTSFGYFENDEDNLRTIKAIKAELKPSGYGVIDFLNANYVIENLVSDEQKKVGDVTFFIERYVEDGYIFKNIRFQDKGQNYFFTERVQAITLDHFKAYFKESGIEVRAVFGDYQLNSYHKETSERLILIFN